MKLGVIGIGNMATAIISGVVQRSIIDPENIIVSDVMEERLQAVKHLGIRTTHDNLQVVRESDYVLLAVKPNMVDLILAQIKGHTDGKVIISIAAGISSGYIRATLGEKSKVIRTMPNVPALVGEGMTAIAKADNVDDDQFSQVCHVFDSIGRTAVLHENYINAATATSGSGPAYVFMMIEAMADAAVLLGIPRKTAYLMVSQTILGAAKLAIETGEHPGSLKDMVTSPGGTAIEAVYQLEQDGFRASLIKAIERCEKKAEQLSK